MDYILGQSLKTTLREHQYGDQVSEEQILDWFTQICQGVQYLHENGVAHGQLFTEKIYVASSGQIKIRPNMTHTFYQSAKLRALQQPLPPELSSNG